MQFGLTLIKWSLLATLGAALPLVLIMLMGGESANPIGPGLLFLAVATLAALFLPCGVVISGIAWLRGERH